MDFILDNYNDEEEQEQLCIFDESYICLATGDALLCSQGFDRCNFKVIVKKIKMIISSLFSWILLGYCFFNTFLLGCVYRENSRNLSKSDRIPFIVTMIIFAIIGIIIVLSLKLGKIYKKYRKNG